MWLPTVLVSSVPGELELFESRQVAIPGPDAPSEQVKCVATLCLTAYVPPDAGELIAAVGAAAAV